MGPILTVKDIQEKLHLGRSNAYELVSRPDFPKIKIGNKILCYEEDLDSFLQDYKYSEKGITLKG